jgi:1,4-alpha-glucan branching enzyme
MRPKCLVASVTLTLATLVAVACAGRVSPLTPRVTPAGVEFVFVDATAASVAVAGPFNQWSTTAHPLARNGAPGTWTIVVPLPPGDHPFMFVVDGTRWVSPPMAEEYVDDGFGARNGVVVVRPTAH